MRAVLEANQNLLAEYERVFRGVDEALSKSVKALGNELISFQEDATEQLRRQLGVFDEHLGAATDKIGASFSNVGGKDVNVSRTLTIHLHTIGETSTDVIGRSCDVILASVRPGKRAESTPEPIFRIQC